MRASSGPVPALRGGTGSERRLVAALCASLWLIAGCGDDDDSSSGKADSGTSGRGGSGSSGSSGSSAPDSGIKPLGDNVAGDECTSADDCGGAMCATQIPGATMILQTAAPDGYCTGQCLSNTDCGMGGVCVGAVPGVVNGQCFASCASDGDCRDGYVCARGLMVAGIVIPDSCRPKPMTDQLQDGTAGDACTAATDCPGGTCLMSRGGFMGMGATPLPGGYCTGNCTEDSHCGSGGVCSPPLFQGLTGGCYEGCTDDGDCNREGYRCRELGMGKLGCDPFPDPLPDNNAGKACTSDTDCGGVMGTCDTALPGTGFFAPDVPAPEGYCSQVCGSDADCGAGGVCVGASFIASGACFKPCTTMADCRTGYRCETRGGGMGMGAPAAPADGGMSMSSGQQICAPVPQTTPPPDADAGG
jgi:hypothetical protein